MNLPFDVKTCNVKDIVTVVSSYEIVWCDAEHCHMGSIHLDHWGPFESNMCPKCNGTGKLAKLIYQNSHLNPISERHDDSNDKDKGIEFL